MEPAGGIAGAPLQVHRGASQLKKGLINRDPARALGGKMNLAAGALLLTNGGAPFALASAAVHLALARFGAAGDEEMAKANRVAGRVLAAATGPLGMMGLAIGSELREAGIDLEKASERPRQDPQGQGFLRGLLCAVGGLAAGSVLGAAIGTSLGGVGGAATGAFLGRLGGVALGLGGYGIYRAFRPNDDQKPNALTPGDKKLLTKLVVGATAGGLAGAVLGGLGGSAAGQAVGTALAGPVGGVVGSSLGSFAGCLGGSLALAKVGAHLGRKLGDN